MEFICRKLLGNYKCLVWFWCCFMSEIDLFMTLCTWLSHPSTSFPVSNISLAFGFSFSTILVYFLQQRRALSMSESSNFISASWALGDLLKQGNEREPGLGAQVARGLLYSLTSMFSVSIYTLQVFLRTQSLYLEIFFLKKGQKAGLTLAPSLFFI